MNEENKGWFRRNWKLVINIVTVLALVILAFAIRDQFTQTFENLFRINAWTLLLMLPIQLLNYDAQTRLYQHLFRVVGNKLQYSELFRSSLELNFVNHVFPSGGVTGISYFGRRLRHQGVTTAKATAVHLLKIVLLVVSFEILIAVGVFALAVQGQMNSIVLLLAASLTTLLIVGTLGFAVIIGSKRRIAGFFTFMTRGLNHVLGFARRHRQQETISIDKVRALFEELHEHYVVMSRDWRQLRLPFAWALMANVWEVATIYVVYIAFGEWVNIGAILLAYAVANFAGFISVLPGGIGVYEGLMTLTLSAVGVPSRLSLPVTIMYRVLSTLIQVPPGYVLYHRAINRPKLPQPNTDGN